MAMNCGSSKTWGDASGARLCEVILNANTQVQDQVATGKTDILDILTLAQLNEPDDMGLTLPYLCVYHDRPEILTYLHKRGVDMTKPCDPMGFGTPMFYAVSMRRWRIVERLDKLGVSLTAACDNMKQLPVEHARRIDDEALENMIIHQSTSRQRALALVHKNILRLKCKREYLKIKDVLVPRIQKRMRGVLARKQCELLRLKRDEEFEAMAAALEAEKKGKKKKKKKGEKKPKEEEKKEAEGEAEGEGDGGEEEDED